MYPPNNKFLRPLIQSFFIIVSSLMLVNCGGGSSDSTPTTSTLSGTAATGAPIIGTILVKGSTGNEATTAIDASGFYTVNVTGLAPPYLIEALPTDTALPGQYSFASKANITVNVTPLSTLTLFNASGSQELAFLQGDWVNQFPSFTQQQIDATQAIINANFASLFSGQGLDTLFNYFSDSFNVDSTGFNAILDALLITLDPVNDSFAITYNNSPLIFDVNIDIGGGTGNLGTVNFNTTSTGIPLSSFTPALYSEGTDGELRWQLSDAGNLYTILISPDDGVLIFSEVIIGGETKAWLGSSSDVIISSSNVDFNNASLTHSLGTVSTFSISGSLERGTSGTNTDPGTGGGTSNISIVSGSQLGSNDTANNQLRKSISFSLDNPHNDFAFGAAYAAKITSTSSAFYWMVEVTNSSNQTHCFIKVIDGRYLSSTGSELGTDSLAFVDGELRKLSSSDIYTNTCLSPGSNGHFIGIDTTIPMEQVSSIVFNSLTVSSSVSLAPDLSMTATSYEADSPGNLLQNIDLTVLNNGPVDGILKTSFSILLDDNDDPLIWSFFSVATGGTDAIASKQSGIISNDLLYEGSSNKLIIYLNYEAQTVGQAQFTSSKLLPVLTKEDFSTTEDYLEYILGIKNQNEYLKQLSQ